MPRVHEEDLELYVFGRLEKSKVSVLESRLIECRQCRLKLGDAAIFERQLADIAERRAAYNGPEKRSELRTPTLDSASIRVFTPIGRERLKVQVLDSSKNGLRFR